MKTTAVILAGGKGTRIGDKCPKQFICVKDKPVIYYTITAFENNNNISDIIIVSNAEYMEECRKIVINNKFHKISNIIEGGKERFDSTLAALKIITDNRNILIHDAARPIVSQEIINNVIAALETYNAVNLGVEMTDTIIKTSVNNRYQLIDRKDIWTIQTPQGFKSDILKKAYEIGLKDPNFMATDDCGVVMNYKPDEKIHLIKGEKSNIKITYPEDLKLMEKLIP